MADEEAWPKPAQGGQSICQRRLNSLLLHHQIRLHKVKKPGPIALLASLLFTRLPVFNACQHDTPARYSLANVLQIRVAAENPAMIACPGYQHDRLFNEKLPLPSIRFNQVPSVHAIDIEHSIESHGQMACDKVQTLHAPHIHDQAEARRRFDAQLSSMSPRFDHTDRQPEITLMSACRRSHVQGCHGWLKQKLSHES